MQHLTIITGHSRGLGLELARQRLDASHHVLGLARQPAPLTHPALTQWSVDLADAAPAAERLRALLAERAPDDAVLTLINNAGVMAPLRPLGEMTASDMLPALRVGLEAAMLLTAAFLAGSAHHPGPRRVLNISSGLGRRAMAASAPYCAAKAGLDHFTRAVALDYPAVRCAAVAPGVFDTDMQRQLRSADPASFPDRERFVQLAAQGELASAQAAAARVLAYLDRADFGHQPVADVRG